MPKPFRNISRKSCAVGGVFTLLHRVLRLHKRQKGGILIEFTFSIPVCIALLFLVNDHYRFYELKNKAKTSTYLAASILQHIKNNKTDKTLTKDDLARIAFASCLNFFHTKSMFNPFPFGLYYAVNYVWVKRINSNSYQSQHCYATTSSGTSPMGMNRACLSIVTTRTAAYVEAINPDLVCEKDGDERVFVECCYRKINDSFKKSQLGFFILTPKTYKSIDGMTNNFFTYQIVFTPKPGGLFPAKNE